MTEPTEPADQWSFQILPSCQYVIVSASADNARLTPRRARSLAIQLLQAAQLVDAAIESTPAHRRVKE